MSKKGTFRVPDKIDKLIFVSSDEMKEILNNPKLMKRLKKGSRDARRMKGKMVG